MAITNSVLGGRQSRLAIDTNVFGDHQNALWWSQNLVLVIPKHAAGDHQTRFG
jgi:hypothetical protein